MKKAAICLLISFGIAAVLLRLENFPFYGILDQKLYDIQMILRKQPRQDPRILFVNMDDQAIDQLGRWPWPRNVFANMINTLTSLGVKQILFDVTFTQPNQVFIDKEAVGHIFEGREAITQYINDETGILKGQTTVDPQDSIYTLTQIRVGLVQYTDAAEQKLKEALTDNDRVLADAFRNSHSFIGYSFEVITEPKDIAKDKRYPVIQDKMIGWVRSHPDKSFADLPKNLQQDGKFDTSELKEMFLRARLTPMIEQNLELSLSDAAGKLGLDPAPIRTNFNLTKSKVIEDRIEDALDRDPGTKMIDLIYQNEIFDQDTQKTFAEVWQRSAKEFAIKTRFGRAAPEKQRFLKANHVEPPITMFTDVVAGGGFLNGIPDGDGVLRSVPLFIRYKDTIYPHIAMASVLDLYKPEKITFRPGKYIVLENADINGQKKNIRIPIDKSGVALINWAGRWNDAYRHISGADVYRLYYLQDALAYADKNTPEAAKLEEKVRENEEILGNKVKNSICIIGLTAAGTHDFNPIPYESVYPMVGTHGNVLNSILTAQFLKKVPASTDRTVLFVLAAAVGIGLLFLPAMPGLFFILAIIAGIFIHSLYWFNEGVVLNSASPLLMSLCSYIGIRSYKFATEEKAKREIKNAFSKYVAPDVIEEIMQDPSKLELGGERRILAVLFSDIRSFTTYSENRTPEEIVTILNEYLDAMTKVIVEHKGTLDKYVGDEIMAVWGAPKYEPPEISTKRAVICAVKMLERLKELHAEWKKRGLEPLDIGVGINTGEMITGNMGSELRMDYTVIGDAVNLAARVEALTRDFNAHFMITEDTYQLAKDIIEVRQLEAIKVKGKDIPVMMYEVLSLKTDRIPELS